MNSYTSPEVASAFEAFWSNTADLQDKFIDYWRVVATKFANNSNILGYDIINEPFPANLYRGSGSINLLFLPNLPHYQPSFQTLLFPFTSLT